MGQGTCAVHQLTFRSVEDESSVGKPTPKLLRLFGTFFITSCWLHRGDIRNKDFVMKKTMMLATVLAIGLSAPALAQSNGDRSNGPFFGHSYQSGAFGAYARGRRGSNYVVRDRDINRRLPNARNAQTGGRPNNPNLGPVDSSGNSPSDNR